MTPETRQGNWTTRPVLTHFLLDLNPTSLMNTEMYWSIPPIWCLVLIHSQVLNVNNSQKAFLKVS